MPDIISELSSQLGLDAGQTQTGAGAILKFVQQHAAAGDFNQILAKVPGAQDWIAKAQAAPAADAAPAAEGGLGGGLGGLLGGGGGGLMGAAGGLLGALSGGQGGAAGLAGVLAKLEAAGITPQMAIQFVPALVEKLRAVVGPETVDRLIDQVPGLKEGAASVLGSFLRK